MTTAPQSRTPESPLADFTEYLRGDLIAREEEGWIRDEFYKRNAAQVKIAAAMFSLGDSFSLLEFGCGSGFVPTQLPESVRYTGIDKHPELLALARAKNAPSRNFVQADIRHPMIEVSSPDLVCSFAVLKHFGLHEWAAIFTRMLSFAPHGVFNIQTSLTESFDDGVEYHHVWVAESLVESVVAAAHRRIAHSETLWEDSKGRDRVFYTTQARDGKR